MFVATDNAYPLSLFFNRSLTNKAKISERHTHAAEQFQNGPDINQLYLLPFQLTQACRSVRETVAYLSGASFSAAVLIRERSPAGSLTLGRTVI